MEHWTPEDELEAFKTRIDLREYAATVGYQIDRRESYRSGTVMRKDGDKIVIQRKANGHFVYYSFHFNEFGTIIDFVGHRRGLNLGEIRKELRAWAGVPEVKFAPLITVSKDSGQVRERFAQMKRADYHPYLQVERAIPESVFSSEYFFRSIYIDHRGNAVFPHYDVFPFCDGENLCGYEIKNRGFTGFSSGGMKGLWVSFIWPESRHFVVCESAIDALSYSVLYPARGRIYVSVGGTVSAVQHELFAGLVKKMATDCRITVTAAMDADDAGRKLSAEVIGVAKSAGSCRVLCYDHIPDGFKDWNEQLVMSTATGQRKNKTQSA